MLFFQILEEMKLVELLAPAGSREALVAAVENGANAIYLAGNAFGARAYANNFDREELREAIHFAHLRNVAIHVTVNTIVADEELEPLKDYLRFLYEAGADAILVQDLGVAKVAHETVPDLPLHASTQMSVSSIEGVRALAELGFTRAVLAREMSLKEVREIRAKTQADLEMFVHGAMCISYSGRCLLSNYFTGRDSNRGSCAQSCRWKYALVEETRPGKYFPIEEDERGTYIMNSKDMCLLPHIADVIESGVESLKIEGRMKSVHYVASVTRAYRLAIDAYFEDPEHFQIEQPWLDELEKVSHRPYTTGFYYHQPDADDQLYGTSSYQQTSEFIGLVRSYDPDTQYATVEQRNNMKLGQEIEVFQPNAPLYRQKLSDMLDEEGNPIEVAPHAQQIIKIRMDKPVEPYTILRRDI